ncbi:MAG: hypothetical protein ACLRZ7_05575 [Lachnospiraceae bacterium]
MKGVENMTYIVLAFIKVLDNIILTAKSILTYMNKRVLSSVLVCISQVLFYTVVKQVIADNSIVTIIIVSVASGVGNYLAFPIIDKFKKDDKWNFYLTSSDKEDVLNLCNYLVENKIKYVANLGYTRKGVETINVTAFSKTKSESKLIDQYLDHTDAKYLKEITK